MAATRSSRLFTDLHDPRLGDLVRASTGGAAAVAALVPSALRAEPVGPQRASSHTVRTLPRANTGYGSYRVTAPRDPSIPANDGSRRVGRFTY